METYSSWMNCPKEKCVSADLMHLFLVRFVTVRSTYIFIDYPDSGADPGGGGGGGAHPAPPPPPKIGKKIIFFRVKS